MHTLAFAAMDLTNRRKTERIPVAGRQEVMFGRNAGVFMDLSPRGARIRHNGSVRRGASVRVSFTRAGARFSANAEILATRLVSLGSRLTYESRVHFSPIDHLSEQVLRHTLDDIVAHDVRRNVANMLGSNDTAQPKSPPLTDSYVRCRLHGSWWETKITNDRTQPADGFLLPAESTSSEIATLCDTYSAGNEEDREMIRLMAAAALG